MDGALPSMVRILAVLVRRTWLLAFVVVLVCAAFAARAVAALTEADELASSPGAAPAPPARLPPPARPPLDGDVLVERNIFCSSCTPRRGGAGPTNSPLPGYAGQPAVLIATSLGAAPRATVRVVPTEIAGSWGLGDVIPGVGRVTHIAATAVDVVDDAGRAGRLSLLDAPNRSEAAGPVDAGAATPAPRPAAARDPFAGRIRKLSDTELEVERDLVRELVSGAVKPGGVLVVPVLEGGEIRGLRVSGVRPGSVAAALQLRSGDVITSIAGGPIKNAQQLLDLLGKLDQLTTVDVSGTRAGGPLGLTLRLR